MTAHRPDGTEQSFILRSDPPVSRPVAVRAVAVHDGGRMCTSAVAVKWCTQGCFP